MAKRKKPEAPWAVVCTDFHQVIGPYNKKEAAVQAARLTGEGSCVYMPVRMTLTKPPDELTQSEARKHPGQYL